LHLLSLPDFRRLWFIGFSLSVVRWLEMLALALFAYKLTSSALVVAILTMLRLLPMGLFGASSRWSSQCRRRSRSRWQCWPASMQ
jgi:hypothetical protein